MKDDDCATVAHRTLRNHSAEVLRRVEHGETIQVTNHGKVVAVLSPPARTPPVRVRSATVRGGFSTLTRYRADDATRAILDDLRDDR